MKILITKNALQGSLKRSLILSQTKGNITFKRFVVRSLVNKVKLPKGQLSSTPGYEFKIYNSGSTTPLPPQSSFSRTMIYLRKKQNLEKALVQRTSITKKKKNL